MFVAFRVVVLNVGVLIDVVALTIGVETKLVALTIGVETNWTELIPMLALIVFPVRIVALATPPPGYRTPPTLPPTAAIEPTVAIDDTTILENTETGPSAGGYGKPLIELTVTEDKLVILEANKSIVRTLIVATSSQPMNPTFGVPILMLGRLIDVVLMFPKLVIPPLVITPNAFIVDAWIEDVKI